jgi:hypothetical protein
MADHRAEQVMAAVMGKLTSPPLATVPAAQVLRGRGEEVAAELTPALRVYMGADPIVDPWAPQLIDSELEVFIEAKVHDAATNVETLLNQVRKEVNIALAADYTLGLGFVHAIVELGPARPQISGDMAKPAASMEMSYRVKYRRSRTDPST